jgi:hypothetical protein
MIPEPSFDDCGYGARGRLSLAFAAAIKCLAALVQFSEVFFAVFGFVGMLVQAGL